MVQKYHDPQADELMSNIQSKMAKCNQFRMDLKHLEEREQTPSSEFWSSFDSSLREVDEAVNEYTKYLKQLFPPK